MSELVDRVIKNLEKRRERIVQGKLNCIPSPFKRFSNDFIGLEQECFYTVTSFTKGGKSQFVSYAFIYYPLMYCYNHPETGVKLKIIYFPLEETPERILQRFMSWFMYEYTGKDVRISPRELRSTQEAVDEEILEFLKTKEAQEVLNYFTDHIIFPEENCNPTGMYKFCVKYAEEHGTVYYKTIKVKNEFGIEEEKQVFERYEQDDPDEYRFIISDHVGIMDTERGMTLKQCIDKWSEYSAKYLRNRYHYSPVFVQQQSFEQEGNESFKLGRIRPSVAGLGDSKYTSRDSNIVLGIFSPYKFGLKEYEKYDITKFRDNIRFLEVCVNRDGEMGGLCPLFFDGAVCQFNELPLPDDSVNLQKVYKYLETIRKKKSKTDNMFFMYEANKTVNKLQRKKKRFSFAALLKSFV